MSGTLVILAGGLGSRLAEETTTIPKPLVTIGSMPVIWHVMKIYASAGVKDFVICLGYKGYLIKEYFLHYNLHNSDVTFDLSSGRMKIHRAGSEPWRVTLVDTGDSTMTGGRLKRIAAYVKRSKYFYMTYGDGVADIDIGALTKFHQRHKKAATVTAVRPPGRFGAIKTKGDLVSQFVEKPTGDGGWINGGFFVLSPSVLDLITDDDTVWEERPLKTLAGRDQLAAYKHDGFWHPMDTLRDRRQLEKMWESGDAPWKIWK